MHNENMMRQPDGRIMGQGEKTDEIQPARERIM